MMGILYVVFVVWVCWWAWAKWGRDKIVTTEPMVEKSGGLALLERWKPKAAPEPSAVDLLVASAPKPKDPFGTTKQREVRRIAKEIQANGKPWPPGVPSVSATCYICKTERVPSAGVLICPTCDHYIKELVTV